MVTLAAVLVIQLLQVGNYNFQYIFVFFLFSCICLPSWCNKRIYNVVVLLFNNLSVSKLLVICSLSFFKLRVVSHRTIYMAIYMQLRIYGGCIQLIIE